MMADDEEQDEIFRVDTVPPPAGDDDAYDAPTRVGPASIADWAPLIEEADVKGRKSAAAAEQAPLSGRPKAPSISKAPAAAAAGTAPVSGVTEREQQREASPPAVHAAPGSAPSRTEGFVAPQPPAAAHPSPIASLPPSASAAPRPSASISDRLIGSRGLTLSLAIASVFLLGVMLFFLLAR